MSIFRRRRPSTVTFCDRCGQACGAGCRARATRARHRDHAIYTLGGR
jgi:hypothetical protein